MPRYELSKGTSHKFWSIDLAKTKVTTTYGRIGTTGQSTSKSFTSAAAAQAAHDALVAEKIRKGYKLATAPAPRPAPPPGSPLCDLAAAFRAGQTFKTDKATYKVKLVPLDTLVVPTGKLFAADPFTFARVVPFERTIKRGRYPVIASVADIKYKPRKGYNQQRVGAVMLRIASGSPARWVNATKRGQKLSSLAPGEAFGYGVDAGTGCIADVVAAESLAFLNDVEMANDNYDGWLTEKVIEKLGAPTWGGQAITEPKTGANIIAFHSGWGDGVYSSYWGLSRSGAPLCLVTDFGVYPGADELV